MPITESAMEPVYQVAKSYVCQQYGVTGPELYSPATDRHLVSARALYVWLVRDYYGINLSSFACIGRWINRDRSSATRLFVKAEKLRAENPVFRELCDRFKDHLSRG